MSLEIHKEMVRNEFKLWELEGDEKLIDECYASDCIWHAPGGQVGEKPRRYTSLNL